MGTRSPSFGVDAIARSFVDPKQDRRIKRGYLRWFRDSMRVLDVGCGNGALLEELRDVGIEGVGVDASPGAIELCRTRGLVVECGDALDYLAAAVGSDQVFDGVALVHVIEHLPPERALRVIELAARLLPKDGTLLIVTPNCRNHVVLEEVFWLDPTHLRPYPRPLLERMCMAHGLRVIASLDDPHSRPRRGPIRRAISRLRSLISGADRSSGMDAIVVALSDGGGSAVRAGLIDVERA